MIVRFLLAAFAVWRLSHMLSFEDGPGDWFSHLRIQAGAQIIHTTDMAGQSITEWDADHWYGKLLLCPLCLSVWFAAPAALWVTGLSLDSFLTWLAISGAASLAELLVSRS